jgi:hypothetical protein
LTDFQISQKRVSAKKKRGLICGIPIQIFGSRRLHLNRHGILISSRFFSCQTFGRQFASAQKSGIVLRISRVAGESPSKRANADNKRREPTMKSGGLLKSVAWPNRCCREILGNGYTGYIR